MRHRGKPLAWTTVTAAAIIVLVTVPFARVGADLAGLAFGDGSVAAEQTAAIQALGLPSQDGIGLVGATALLALGLSAWSVAIAGGLLARRIWARFGGLLTFGLFAFIMVPLTVGTLPAPAPLGTAVSVGIVTILTLLSLQRTADDVDDAEWLRARRLGMGEHDSLIRRFRIFLASVRPDDFRDA